MLKVLSSILCDLDPKVKALGQKGGICDGVPSTSALVIYNCQIAFFFKLILFVYFTSSCDELYIFHLYLAAFVFIFPQVPRGGGGGGGGGGRFLSFFLHTLARAQHLLFTPKNISGISSTPKILEMLATPKIPPF